MRLAKRYLPIVLAMLLLAFSATSAMALTGVNQQGEMAIESNDQLLFLLTATDNNTALNKVALAGGEPENIDMHTTIDDLVAVGEKVYYLRYDPPSYQIIATDSNGAQLEILSQFETQEVSKLSYYDDVLYCLVDGILTLVDPETGEPDELNANVKMSEYVIVNDVIYYVSTDDLHEYQATSGELVANASVGKLYSMSITGSNPELVLDKGVGDLKAYGNYVYMHNYDDSYLTADSDGSSWLQGRLYRMNTETNQLASMALGYDWDYYITPYGVVVYTNEDLSLYPLAGGTGKQLMKPAAISSVMAAGSNAYVFEYEAGKMTRVPLDGGSNKALFSGSKIASIPSPVTAEDDTTIEYQVDDEGNLITDEEGNAVPVEGQTTQEGEKSYEKTDGYIFPNSETERLTEEEVLAVDSSMLELGRVEVLARHGYEFKTKSYQEYFDGKSWYT
ncbi:DUF5050 domain-containing protein, partial [Eubacteriales bacterium OttesenSCG-928-N13]|nr:DUF5050 domain-containing protein [Eubacteriales bacterium OttesenSCG-928-N13]